MSGAGRSAAASDGYSLTELLAVLALMALIVSLASTSLPAGLSGTQTRQAVSKLADTLRQGRERAISGASQVRFVLDVQDRRFELSGTATGGDLPKDCTLTLRTATNEVINDRIGSISFYPDGSSSGGGITLQSKGQVWEVTVGWLTGRVTTSRRDS